VATAIILGASGLLRPAGYAQDEATFLRHTEDGTTVERQRGLSGGNHAPMLPSPYVVWSCHLPDAIYQTTSNTVGGYVLAGTYLNPPEETELFAPDGGGVPEWGYAGTEFFTDAGDAAFTLAAVDQDGAGINVIKWTGPGNGTPDWTTSFAGYGVTSYGPIAVSDDGSTIAVTAAPPGTDAHLLLFGAGSSTPLVNYVASGLGFPRYVKVSADGRYTAFIASATIVIYDSDSLCVRGQIAMGFSNDALDISGDGNFIAYGWPVLKVLEWNGVSYQELWSWSAGGGYYLSTAAVSTDGTTIVSCWYTTSYNTVKVVVHNAGSPTPLWTHDYPYSSGVYQEVPVDVDITDDGNWFIVGSLGDADNLNPEVHIFQRDDTPHLYYTVDMPGSVFSVDILSSGRYATACGKHVHANQMGRGGDIVLIDMDLIGVSHRDIPDLPGEFALMTNSPNPFSSTTALRYYLQVKSEVRLEIYSSLGERIATLANGKREGGTHTVAWDGRDDTGTRVSTGTYFCRLTARGSEGVQGGWLTRTEKILFLR